MNNIIYIIGTCHGDTTGFKVDDLYKQLLEIKPDIILDESPIDNMWPMMDWLKGCADHSKKRGGGEAAAVLRYLEDHRAEVLPYDIKGRNDYFIKMKFFEKEQAFNVACSAYFKQPSANPTASYLYKLIEGMGRRFGVHETRDKRTIFDINSPLCDVQVETYISLIRNVNKALFDLVPEFSQYEKDYWIRQNFHARRDKAMISNILNYNSRFEDKTIVVLSGYFHRYALVHGLRDNATRGRFFLKDI